MNDIVVVKAALDRAVAEFAGKPVEEISAITEMFLQEVARALATTGGVRLDRLGTLHIATKRGVKASRSKAGPILVTKYYVYFMKSAGLKAAIAAARSSAVKKKEKSPWKNSELAKMRMKASRRKRLKAAQAAERKS